MTNSRLRNTVGVALWLFGVSVIAPAQTFTTFFTFGGSNGANPSHMSLVQGVDGELYGTTFWGGINGYGTVFKITTAGQLTLLHSFNSFDGLEPEAGLLLASDGNFYGTTYIGGTDYTGGTIFKITPAGSMTTLHNFIWSDGAAPNAALIQASNGQIYGTTTLGGAISPGTVFRIGMSGALTTLHSFDITHGAEPNGALIQGGDGDFYGTTYYGGAGDYGTVFKITSGGKLTILHDFNSTDGANPYGGLVQGGDGNFYGTTANGGANYCYEWGCGTVFKITPQGALTVLHSFNSTDGANPWAGLILATDGNFYGTTYQGGTQNIGTIFKITPQGTLTTLHNLAYPDGGYPYGGLLQATDGNFYGSTFYGGPDSDGTLFTVSAGLTPFVKTMPGFGKVGASIAILGTNLTGAGNVRFNGTPAEFTVVSASEIRATVPAGATSGPVEVTTPGGVLFSNRAFQVH